MHGGLRFHAGGAWPFVVTRLRTFWSGGGGTSRQSIQYMSRPAGRADDSVAGWGTNEARNQWEWDIPFSHVQPRPRGHGHRQRHGGEWRCLGAWDSLVLFAREGSKHASGPHAFFFWIGACRRREKGLIRVGGQAGITVSIGGMESLTGTGGIPSLPRSSSQNSMKNVGVLDRRHCHVDRTGVPAVQCRLCCAAFATLILPESICVSPVLAVGSAWVRPSPLPVTLTILRPFVPRCKCNMRGCQLRWV